MGIRGVGRRLVLLYLDSQKQVLQDCMIMFYVTWKTPLRLKGGFNFHVSCSMDFLCWDPSYCVPVAAFVLRVRLRHCYPYLLSNYQICFGPLPAIVRLALVMLMLFFVSRLHWSKLEEQSAFWLSSFLTSELSKTEFGSFLTLMFKKLFTILQTGTEGWPDSTCPGDPFPLLQYLIPASISYWLIPLTCLGWNSSTSEADLQPWLLADHKFCLCLILVTFCMHCNLFVCFSARRVLY